MNREEYETMQNNVLKYFLVLGIILLFIGTSIAPCILGAFAQPMKQETTPYAEQKTNDSLTGIVTHLATKEDIEALKQQAGVYDPAKNYNIIYDGHGTGYAPPSEADYIEMVGSLIIVDELPPPNPLRSVVDLSADSCFPIIGNQGGQGSCAAWAATYYATGYVISKNYDWTQAHSGNSNQLLSPAWTYNKCNYGYDSGSVTWENMRVSQRVGTARLSTMPYNDGDPVGWGNENAWRDAPPYRVNQIYQVTKSLSVLKATLDAGYPITFALDADSYGYFGSDNVLGLNAMRYSINHANTVVGYDDTKVDAETGETGAFKVANSWGYWGPTGTGYYWMTYAALQGSWNTQPMNYVTALYTPGTHPTILGRWSLNPRPNRDASVTLGIGPHGAPLETRQPWWNGYSGSMHTYPSFMCLDISEFFNEWISGGDSFYLEIGDAAQDGTITSFKVEYYETIYTPGSPTRTSPESPDTPKNTPGYVTVQFGFIDYFKPQWQNQGQNRTTIQRGEPILLTSQGKDGISLNKAFLATNETGVWQNITSGMYGSPISYGGIQDQWVWSNFSWHTWAVPQGRRVGWRIYYNDTSGNWNRTNIMSFYVLRNPIIYDYTSLIASTGSSFTFNASVYDDDGIAAVYVDYWYEGGVHTNVSMMLTGGYYQRTITAAADKTLLYYIIHAKDNLNLWGHTAEKIVTIIDTLDPEIRNQGQSSSAIPPGGSVTLSAQSRDNIGLDFAYLSTNETGEWVDYATLNWWNFNWEYSKRITIDHTKVQADFTDFPVVITCTSSDFTNHAQPDGDDFVFVSQDNSTQYAHEIEYYYSPTGELTAWVKIPFLSSTTDTILYLYYGNPSCNNQEYVEETWSNGFIMVQHMSGASYTELDDSTANHWDITSSGGGPLFNQQGKIGKCVDFDGSNDYVQTSGFRIPADAAYTASAWVYVDGNNGQRRYLFEGDGDYSISLHVWTNESFKARTHTSTDIPVCYSDTHISTSNPQWYYTSTRLNPTTDLLEVMVNGLTEAGIYFTGTINPETIGLNIGTNMDNNAYWMNGKIDEIRIANVIRSDAWTRTEYIMMSQPSSFAIIGEETEGISAYGSPLNLNTEPGVWAWANFTWQNPGIPEGTRVGWKITFGDTSYNIVSTDIMSFMIGEMSLFEVRGYCTYPDMSPANIITVDISNLNTGGQWQADTNNNYYTQFLVPGDEIHAGDTLRIIARDNDNSVNVTNRLITTSDIAAGYVQLDLTLKVHYRDLKQFPFYLSQVNSGAMVMKQMLDYCMWNDTLFPEPQSVYNEQTLYNTYAGGNQMNVSELSGGLNAEIDDHGHGWIYGYFFAPSGHDLAVDALKSAVIWLDYNISGSNEHRLVDVPKEGHPYHVPIAVPTGGSYDHWMVIRGIHTNRSMWDTNVPGDHELINGPVTIYGFWVNDPVSGGVGNNVYVTYQYFNSTYFQKLNVPGDYYNNKFVVITDPPRDAPAVNTNSISLKVGTQSGFTLTEIKTLKTNVGSFVLGQQAIDFVNSVLSNDLTYGSLISGLRTVGKPMRTGNGYIITVGNTNMDITVKLGVDGAGQQFSVHLK
ncbi:MAG: DUF2341 domain-containing protein [Methanobacteriota archaeon]